MQLDDLVNSIERQFGADEPPCAGPGEHGFEVYLEDQVNRRIIRDFFINAIVLGHLPRDAVIRLGGSMATPQCRGPLAPNLLMMAVEDAASLLRTPPDIDLVPLAEPADVSHLTLVEN